MFSTLRPVGLSKEEVDKNERRNLFEEADRADAEFEAAQQAATCMLDARSLVIKRILNKFGKGPFTHKGKRVIIVARKNGTCFFREQGKQEAEEI